jgi:folate-dependent tRNA-U54 methylase TrmFO/GidA
MSQESGDVEAAEKLTKAFNELSELILLLRRDQQNSSTNTQTINVNAGGWGVLIALIMVAFLAGLNIAQANRQAVTAAEMVKQGQDVNEIRRKQDRDDDYINSIFRILPEIKQKIDQEKEKENQHANHH